MPTPTDFRYLKDVVVAVAHQAAFGTAASTSAVLKFQVQRAEIDPGFAYIHPRGSVGSQHPKDTHTKVAERPRARLTVFGSPKVAPFLFEYAMHGQPTATLAGSDITEANEGAGVLGTWTFAGVRPGFNTDSSWKLYVTLTDETPGAGQARVSVYSDSGRSQLVAQGSAANGATATLAEQNSSGLSGTVALGTVTATDSDIELTFLQVRPQFSGVIARWFTLWLDYGSGRALERVEGCTIERLARVSEEAGVVLYEVEVVGGDYNCDTGAGGTFTPGIVAADKEYYVHGTLGISTDVDSGNVAQHATRLEFAIENDVEVMLANAGTPSAIWKRGVKAMPLTWRQRLTAEAQVILARGLSDSFEAVTITDAYSTRTVVMTLDKVKSAEPRFPSFGEEGFEEVEHRMQAVEESATTPTAPLAVVIKL